MRPQELDLAVPSQFLAAVVRLVAALDHLKVCYYDFDHFANQTSAKWNAADGIGEPN